MSTVNEEVFDRIVANMANTRLYENGLQIQNRRILTRHRTNLKKLLTGDIKANLTPEAKRFNTEISSHLESSMREFSTAELDFQTNNLDKSISKFYKTQRPRAKDLLAEIEGPHIKGVRTVRSNLDNISAGELVRIQSKVKAGLATGKSKDAIVSDVLKTTKITEIQAKTLTRTSITSTQTAAMRRVMDSNKSALSGYVFTAILDSRTSPICSHHNGKTYDIDDTSFMPPLHWNCRSALIPIVKDKKTLLAEQDARIKKTPLKAMEEGKLDGAAAPRESFGAWLKRQAYTIQKDILGDDERVNFFREGQLKFENFVDIKGKALSIQALRRKATEATALFMPRQKLREVDFPIKANTPAALLKNPKHENDLKAIFQLDADDYNKTLALTDYKGTTLLGKQASRRRVGNQFDERNFSADPLTGEVKNNLLYDPDTGLFQERLDFMRASKLIKPEQKDFIERVAVSLDDKISVNQQTVIVDNLRVVFERYAKNKDPWSDFTSVVRAENRFAVQNVSRMLDVRSRKRSEMFIKYLSSKDTSPEVQLFGKYYKLDDLADSQLSDQRFINNWRANAGKKLATEVYLKGRAPGRVYFHGIAKSVLPRETLVETLLKDVPFRKAYKAFKALYNREPSDSWITKVYASGRETYRSILDLEFLYKRQPVDTLLLDKEAITSLSKVAKLIGSGQTTDYDLLSIKIGQQLNKDFPNLLPFKTATIMENHREGSKILKMFEDSGMIKVNFRGKTRRGVLDIDTGRASGGWADTVSREVTVTNDLMQELQLAERKVTISRRLGVTRDRDRFYVKAGEKTYFDARGNDTGVPIISADKFPDYDPKQIDREIASMMNHVMDTEYSVDKEFFGFMDDVVRFRDPRGNSKYYDGLNEFRHEILNRGEQGYGMMSTAKYHAQRGKTFRTDAFIDSRGRVYHRGYLTPTGGEMVRPFLNSGKAVAFSKNAHDELRTQLGAMIGPGTEALTVKGRLAIFERNKAQIISLGDLMQQTTQRDRRLREFLEHPLIKGLEGPEVPKLARMALEYSRLDSHLKAKRSLSSFQTRLMIENDASSSGAQIISLSTGDRAAAVASNVLATKQKNRLYDLVAMDTINDPEYLKIKALRDAGLTWEDLAKGAKAQNMVSFYGAGDATKTANVASKLSKILDGKGFFSISKENLTTQLSLIDRKIKQADRIGATAVSADLTAFRRELVELVNSDSPVGSRLMKLAMEVHPDTGDFVSKMMNARKGVIGPKDFSEISRIMSKNLAQRAPVTDHFITFWKKTAKVYVNETQQVDIPWVTFDNKVMMQRYRPKLQERIDFTDPVTGRRVANIYEGSALDGKLLGKSSVQDASIGLGVNGNHSNDAVIVRRFHLWGMKNKVGTGTIHDAFFTNIAEADIAKTALRNIYADALEGDTVRKTLLAMRNNGLSKKSYDRLLAEAKKLGLIDPPNAITRKEILAPLRTGEDWYGIGP